MTTRTDHFFAGFHLEGLQNPTDASSVERVLFVNDLATTVSTKLFFYEKLGWLAQVSGESWQADIRAPMAPGGALTVLLDDPDGQLAKLFVFDPVAPIWDLEQARVGVADTLIRISGPTIPQDQQLLWLEGEAVVVDGAPSIVGNTTYDVTIQRGQCGSEAVSHRLIPSLHWVPGSDGSQERLVVRSKPDFTGNRFLATVYLLQEQLGTVAREVKAFEGYLEGRPKAKEGSQWELTIAPLSKAYEAHQGPGAAAMTTPLSRCVEVLEKNHGYAAGGDLGISGPPGTLPQEVALWMTGPEASVLVNEHLMQVGSAGLDQTLVDDQRDAIAVTDERQWCFLLEAAGHRWTYAITGFDYETVVGGPWLPSESYVRVLGRLIAAERGASILGAETPWLAFGGINSPAAPTMLRYNNGFADVAGLPLLETESAPKVTLGLLLITTVARAYLYTGISDGADSSGPYDVLFGKLGLGLPVPRFNVGTPAGDPGDVTKETTELAQLDQICDAVYVLPILPTTKIADLLSDLLRLHLLLSVPLSSGPLTLRYWARPYLGGSTALNPSGPAKIGATLRPLRALLFRAGLDLLTFDVPKDSPPRSVSLRGSRASDFAAAQTIRIYSQNPQALSLSAFQDGVVADCVRAFFLMLQDEPMVPIAPTVASTGVFTAADQVTLTDELVPDYTGRGVSAKRYIAVGANVDWETGDQELLLLADEINNPDVVSAGLIAPTLRVEGMLGKTLTGSLYRLSLQVTSLGEPGALDLATADAGPGDPIWEQLVEQEGYCRVLRLPSHNPLASSSQDRPGWLECYGKVVAVGGDRITLEVSQAWEREGLLLEDYFSAGESFLSLVDRRVSNVLGVVVDGVPAQGPPPGNDYLTFVGPQSQHQSQVS